MAQSAKRLKREQERNGLEIVPKSKDNPFWESTLFSEIYLQNDVPQKYKAIWEDEDSGPFYEFCNQFHNLCVELKGFEFDTWSERTTINRFIKPVLEMLGYKGSATQEPWAEDESFSVRENGQTKTYKPDLIIVNDPKELRHIENKDGAAKVEEARSSVIVPVEAKYWGRIEDERQRISENTKRSDKKDEVDSTKTLDFDEQILKYQEILHKDFGILTDGRTWRLYHRELSNDTYRRHYQFNLSYLMRHISEGLDRSSVDYKIFIENAKYFYHFFSKQALASDSGARPFLDDLLEYSKKYALEAKEDLKIQFVHSMFFACNGFLRSTRDCREKVDLQLIRNVSESHLFNILFIRYCESQNVLPMKVAEYRKISISSTIDKLELYNPEKDTDDLNFPILKRVFSGHFEYRHEGTELYDRLLKLTKIVQVGTTKEESGFVIDGFKESVFSQEEWKFLNRHKLSNREMISVLFSLGYCNSNSPGRRFQQVPYNFFSPRQLGSIYESFLEYKLAEAECNYEYKKSGKGFKWVKSTLSQRQFDQHTGTKATKGQVYFDTDNEDRRATGSYYTPDWLVQYSIAKVLSPLVENKSANEILNIKVCDPAMGSGHFLSAALNFLTRKYIQAVREEGSGVAKMTMPEAKRIVLDKCIFGVDLNERAVKLAMLSLWLESAHASLKLERLDDQLKYGNSIVPKATLKESEKARWKKAFDWSEFKTKDMVFVGNPPWGATMSDETRLKLSEIYGLDMDNLNSFEAFLLLSAKVGVKKSLYVIPRNFIRTDGYEKSRKLLLENQNLLSVADCGACFEGVTQEAVTIEYSSDASAEEGVELAPFAKDGDFRVYGRVRQKDILQEPKCRFNLLYSQTLDKLARRIDGESLLLSDLVEHYRGIEYGKTGEVTPCQKCGAFNSLPKKKKKTKECHRCGKEFNLTSANPYRFISRDKTTKHKIPIVVGKVIDRYVCREFYYMQAGLDGIEYKEQAFRKQDKILLMKISDRLKGYLDIDNAYTTQGIYMLYLREKFKNKISLASILAVLNSPVLKFYYEYRVNMGATLTTNVILDDILKLPIASEAGLASKTFQKADSVVRRLQDAMKSGKLNIAKECEAELATLTYQLFDLSKQEVAAIQEFNEKMDKARVAVGSAENEDEDDEAA